MNGFVMCSAGEPSLHPSVPEIPRTEASAVQKGGCLEGLERRQDTPATTPVIEADKSNRGIMGILRGALQLTSDAVQPLIGKVALPLTAVCNAGAGLLTDYGMVHWGWYEGDPSASNWFSRIGVLPAIGLRELGLVGVIGILTVSAAKVKSTPDNAPLLKPSVIIALSGLALFIAATTVIDFSGNVALLLSGNNFTFDSPLTRWIYH